MTAPRKLEASPSAQPCVAQPVALSPPMVEALYRAHVFAPAATALILYGETGTGKTFLAEYIHQLSERPGGFHAESVSTWAPQFAADELFGHARGAFTGAHQVRGGCIATAGAGTLLLDEMHTLRLTVQKKLLPVFDRGTYKPVGSDRVHTAACRFILAMKDDPDALMKRGRLLKDLRHRFGMCSIWMAPLRERRAEIPVLAQQALEGCRARTKLDGPGRFSDAALALLCKRDYPGNCRDLEGVVLCAYLFASYDQAAEIGEVHVLRMNYPVLRYERRGDPERNRIVVEQMLKITGGNMTKAAQWLGVSRGTVNAARGNRAKGSGTDSRNAAV